MTERPVVLVTGGTRGIGLGIAAHFAAHGYGVVMNYRHDEAQAQAALQQLNTEHAWVVKADVSTVEGREHLVANSLAVAGRIDVLVNNAAILRMGRVMEISPETFAEVMSCNFYGAFFLSQRVAQVMVDQGRGGSIVHISSVGAYGAANISYGTSKAALRYATKCMAKELAKHGIRVNCISPNGVPTDLNKSARESTPERWQKAVDKIPLAREGTVEDMARAVYFLASSDASYITGVDLPVDGGFLC